MKVVFDTNILISGFLTVTGVSRYVFNVALKRHQVILSEFILDELKRKLVVKLRIPPSGVERMVRFLRKRTTLLKVKKNPHIQFKDKDDIPLLELLEFSKAHYFVTGDKDLQTLKKFGHTLILSPREAIEIL